MAYTPADPPIAAAGEGDPVPLPRVNPRRQAWRAQQEHLRRVAWGKKWGHFNSETAKQLRKER